jgi:hypothetical protein
MGAACSCWSRPPAESSGAGSKGMVAFRNRWRWASTRMSRSTDRRRPDDHWSPSLGPVSSQSVWPHRYDVNVSRRDDLMVTLHAKCPDGCSYVQANDCFTPSHPTVTPRQLKNSDHQVKPNGRHQPDRQKSQGSDCPVSRASKGRGLTSAYGTILLCAPSTVFLGLIGQSSWPRMRCNGSETRGG